MSMKISFLSILLLSVVCLPCLGQAGPTSFKPYNFVTKVQAAPVGGYNVSGRCQSCAGMGHIHL